MNMMCFPPTLLSAPSPSHCIPLLSLWYNAYDCLHRDPWEARWMVPPIILTAQTPVSKIPLLFPLPYPSHQGVSFPVLPKPIPEASISLCLPCCPANLGDRCLAQGATIRPSRFPAPALPPDSLFLEGSHSYLPGMRKIPWHSFAQSLLSSHHMYSDIQTPLCGHLGLPTFLASPMTWPPGCPSSSLRDLGLPWPHGAGSPHTRHLCAQVHVSTEDKRSRGIAGAKAVQHLNLGTSW